LEAENDGGALPGDFGAGSSQGALGGRLGAAASEADAWVDAARLGSRDQPHPGASLAHSLGQACGAWVLAVLLGRQRKSPGGSLQGWRGHATDRRSERATPRCVRFRLISFDPLRSRLRRLGRGTRCTTSTRPRATAASATLQWSQWRCTGS
jgi:hypothetical protein